MVGHRVGADLYALLSFPATLSLYSLQISLLMTLVWDKALYLNCFRKLNRSPKFLPSPFGLDCFQLEIICTLKRHFGVANFAPLQKEILFATEILPVNFSSVKRKGV